DLAPGLHWLAPRVGKELLAPVPVLIADVPVTLESNRPHGTTKDAAHVALPTVVAGRLRAASQADCYAFAAKKGEAFEFEIVARRGSCRIGFPPPRLFGR